MKWMFTAVLAVTSLVPFAATHAQSVRHGTIVDMKPIDNRGDDESEQHKRGTTMGTLVGGLLGMKVSESVSGANTVEAINDGSRFAGGTIGGKVAGEGPSAHYMVKLQLDDGKVMALVQTGQGVQGLRVGSKVAVSGSGQNATLAAE